MRRLAGRLLVESRLRLETPLHVGGAGSDVQTDLPIAENGQGRIYIPGTSLAGALRVWCWSTFGEDAVNRLWGAEPSHRAESEASYVLIDDVVVSSNVAVEIRDHVGIARDLGTAGAKKKF